MERERARAELETYRIETPVEGVVTKVFKVAGEAVREGEPVMEICNTSRVRIRGYVSLRDASKHCA